MTCRLIFGIIRGNSLNSCLDVYMDICFDGICSSLQLVVIVPPGERLLRCLCGFLCASEQTEIICVEQRGIRAVKQCHLSDSVWTCMHTGIK